MEPRFTIDESEYGGLAYVSLGGEIDLASVEAIQETVTRQLKDGPVGVVVDLDAVTFLDSMGIGTLVALRLAADEAGIAYRVINPPAKVLNILTIVGVLDTLNINQPPLP